LWHALRSLAAAVRPALKNWTDRVRLLARGGTAEVADSTRSISSTPLLADGLGVAEREVGFAGTAAPTTTRMTASSRRSTAATTSSSASSSTRRRNSFMERMVRTVETQTPLTYTGIRLNWNTRFIKISEMISELEVRSVARIWPTTSTSPSRSVASQSQTTCSSRFTPLGAREQG
jgi:hypothetical protein